MSILIFCLQKQDCRFLGSAVLIDATAHPCGALLYKIVYVPVVHLQDLRELAMGDKEKRSAGSARLRRQAEERLKKGVTAPGHDASHTEGETQRLLHELQVHYIELEMQNEELRRFRDEVEKYVDLFDFAPVGYFTLDRDGVISAVNLSGASLLGIVRSGVIGRRFAIFVTGESLPVFVEYLGKVFASRSMTTCMIELARADKTRLFVRIVGIASEDAQECRIAVIDRSEQKLVEEMQLRHIAELEAAQRTAENKSRLLSAVLEALPVGVAITEAAGGTIQTNRAFEQLWGGLRMETRVVQDFAAYKAWWAETDTPVEPEERASALALQNGVTTTGQLMRIERFDGSEAHVINSASPVFDADGNTVGCVVAVQDITELRRAEENRRRSDELLRLHMDNSPLAIIEWDRDFIVTRWTGGAERIFGWSASETVGKSISELNMIFEEDIPLVERVVTQLSEGLSSQVVVNNRNYSKNGAIRTCTWYNSVLTDQQGRMTSVLSKVIDITEQKLAEEALLQARKELEQRVTERTQQLASSVESLLGEISQRELTEKMLLSLNSLYSVLSETNQVIVRASDRDTLFREICRIAVENGGFMLAWVGLVNEADGAVRKVAVYGASGYLDDIRITVNAEPEGGGPTAMAIRNGSYFICNDFLNDPRTRPWHNNGRIHGVRASASVALKEEGRVIGALTLYATEKDAFDPRHVELLQQMGTDISFAIDNMLREERRQIAEQKLRDETLQRLRAVEALRQQELILIQQNRQAAMGEMIGNIAHQWRQPLNTLGLFTQRLGFFYGSPSFDKEFLDTSVAKSMEIIEYMSRTIDDFRNFFSTEREKSEFRVDEAVNKALSLVEASFKECGIHIEREEQEGVTIFGYPNEYAQVLLNILMNAKDVITERKVCSPFVRICIGAMPGKSLVTICDNAGGIPEDIIDKIFDPYFTTKGPQQGTGIGLFMSKSIIENNMGGKLSVSNSDGGAEFRIEV